MSKLARTSQEGRWNLELDAFRGLGRTDETRRFRGHCMRVLWDGVFDIVEKSTNKVFLKISITY
jgi:hypothetical protein